MLIQQLLHRYTPPAMMLALALASISASGPAWSSEPPEAEEAVAQLPTTQLPIAQLPDEGQPPAPEATIPEATIPEAGAAPEPLPESVAAPAVSSAAVGNLPAPEGQPQSDQPTQPQSTDSDSKPIDAVAEVANAGEFEPVGAAVRPPSGTAPEVRELSVPPVSQRPPLLPADAPAWIHAPPDVSSRVHRLFVGSLPTGNRQEADSDEATQPALESAVATYLDEHVQPGSSRLQIRADFIQQQLVDPATEYLLSVSSPVGTEYQKWVVLRITPEQREYFVEQYRQLQQRERLGLLGLGLAGVLSLTGLANLVFTRRQRRYALAETPLSAPHTPSPTPSQPPHLAAALPVAGSGQPRRVHLLKSVCKTRKSSSCCNWTALKVAKALFVAGVIFTVVSMVKLTKSSRESELHVQKQSPEKVEVRWNEQINQEIRDEINREIRKSFGHWK